MRNTTKTQFSQIISNRNLITGDKLKLLSESDETTDSNAVVVPCYVIISS